MEERVKLTPELMEGFVALYLLDRFEDPKPTPQLHREIWELFCRDDPLVCVVAPRGHAKSTAGTLSFGLASILFGAQDYVFILSSTETMASEHLKNISMELRENEAILEQFKVSLSIDNDTEVVGKVGKRWFKIIAKGAEQKIRGLKWRHKRPGLTLIDDLEDDEAVMNFERRDKLSKWVDNAVMPLGRGNSLIRALGTVLHFDSWLENTLKDTLWTTRRYSAHKDFDDFTEILWPEEFPEARLRFLRQIYINKGNPSGYAKEYLNQPIAEDDAYFLRGSFTPMEEEDYLSPKTMYAAVDFAVSTAERANNSAIVVGGMDPDNYLHIVDCVAGKLGPVKTIDEIFRVQEKHGISLWIMETGQIEKSIGPFIKFEMVRRQVFLNIVLVAPTKDKRARARPLQMRMRAGGVKFDKLGDWYPAYEMEMLQFDRSSRDDRVDATAWLGLYLDQLQGSLTVKELQEEEWENEERESLGDQGRSVVTGY